MRNLKKITGSTHPGQLVFVRIVKNINFDEATQKEVYDYYYKYKPGFILEISKNFEKYYLIRFFTGEKSFHWGADLYEENLDNDLTEEKQ